MKYGSRVGSARVPGQKRTQGCRVAARVAAEPNKQPNKNVLTAVTVILAVMILFVGANLLANLQLGVGGLDHGHSETTQPSRAMSWAE
jgi:hypothetical protein